MVSKSTMQKDFDNLEQDYIDLRSRLNLRVKELEDAAVERGYALLAAQQRQEAAEKERDLLRGQLSRIREAHDHLHRKIYPTPLPGFITPLVPGIAPSTFTNISS